MTPFLYVKLEYVISHTISRIYGVAICKVGCNFQNIDQTFILLHIGDNNFVIRWLVFGSYDFI